MINRAIILGTLMPPELPRVLVADLAGAEQAVSTALSLLFAESEGKVRNTNWWGVEIREPCSSRFANPNG
jgi:hypothetical protein